LAATIIILTALAPVILSPKIPTTHAQTPSSAPIITVTGLVNDPLNLSLSDLKAMPQTTEYAVLCCVASPGTPLQEGDWTGVSLSYLLQLAAPSADAVKVALFAPDDYSTDFSVQVAMQGDILLAYEKDNLSLSSLQLVVPDNWGYKWITNPTQIQLVNYDFLGTTESEGYPDNATIAGSDGVGQVAQPGSQFTLPTLAAAPTSNSSAALTGSPSPIPTTTPTQRSAVSNPNTQQNKMGSYIIVAIAATAACAVTSAGILVTWKKFKK